MTLDEYQVAAHRTAVYPENDAVLYNGLNLLAEVGEVLGVLAKSVRDGVPPDKQKLTIELGDVMWHCAEISTITCSELIMPRYSFTWSLAACGEEMMRDALLAWRSLDIERTQSCDNAIHSLMRWILTIANEYGIKFSDILQMNLDKLESRAERGVIKGSGDER